MKRVLRSAHFREACSQSGACPRRCSPMGHVTEAALAQFAARAQGVVRAWDEPARSRHYACSQGATRTPKELCTCTKGGHCTHVPARATSTLAPLDCTHAPPNGATRTHPQEGVVRVPKGCLCAQNFLCTCGPRGLRTRRASSARAPPKG